MDQKKLTILGKKAKETAESSAGTGALFKEDIPRKVVIADVWENNNFKSPQHGTRLESASDTEVAAEADTLMGRLAKRMASRDMIDELNLGPKGTAAKVKNAQVADFLDEAPGKMHFGMGQHEQTKDIKANNSSDPVKRVMKNPGSTMRDQALNLAKNDVKLKDGSIPDHNFNQEQLNKGTFVEKEHTNDLKIAKQIAKAHLIEDPNYYFKLQKAGL